MNKMCIYQNCDRPSDGGRYCATHKRRARLGLDMDGPIKEKGRATRWIEEVALPYQGDNCLTWPFFTDRYGQYLNTGAHRYICTVVHGEPPTPKHHAAHSCGNGHLGCVNPRHLSWKTPKENMADRKIHGTELTGEKNHKAKITDEEVRQIRALRGYVWQVDLAASYGISRAQVQRIHYRTARKTA